MSVGSPKANFSAHAKAPLCNQQYESTATVCPLKAKILHGFDDFLRKGNSPDIPMLSILYKKSWHQ